MNKTTRIDSTRRLINVHGQVATFGELVDSLVACSCLVVYTFCLTHSLNIILEVFSDRISPPTVYLLPDSVFVMSLAFNFLDFNGWGLSKPCKGFPGSVPKLEVLYLVNWPTSLKLSLVLSFFSWKMKIALWERATTNRIRIIGFMLLK